MEFDEQEKLIIKALIRDPRISDNNIGKLTKVPIRTVSSKRKKLKQENKISIIEKNIVGTMVFLEGSEWRCAGNTCEKWITGNEWVTDNGRAIGENSKMMCKVTVGGIDVGGIRIGGMMIDYALDKIDTSQMKSCKQPVCGAYILIKNTGGK